jgi:DNA-binding Xre family transcriptional regulator
MREHINAQIIYNGEAPAFAVIPYEKYLELTGEDRVLIPHEVVGISIKEDCNLLKAWRIYKKLTQREVAEKAGISQSALSQMEKSDNPRTATLEKLAAALDIHPEQLID